MSADEPDQPSRHTNLNNSVTPAEPGSSADEREELPTTAERVSEFHREYHDRAQLPVTQQHGQSVRREYTVEEYESWTADDPVETERTATGQELVKREPVTWGHAVLKTLKSHKDARRTTVNLEYGMPSDPEYQEWSVEAETRWFASYQKRYYAQMKGWLRELCGGERPSGGETPATYDDPHIALVTLSASSVPDGERVGPVDHTRARRESWSDCYQTLRNTLRAKGYELGEDWQYDRRAEPHTGERGGGVNHCYGHDHVVIVVDGALEAADLRPVVEKHVESCEWAGAAAHDLDVQDWRRNEDSINTVEVKAAAEVDNLGNYVASYCGIRPVDLHERSIEYIAWAAAVDAANLKTVSRSDAAKHAAAADACKQRAESPSAEQSADHGENVVPSLRRGYEYECGECGSPHGIDQHHESLTAAQSAAEPVADGGIDREQELRENWPNARGGARVGESPTRARWRDQIEDYLEQNPDASLPQLLGDLRLPPDARDVLDELEAGFDPYEPVGFDRGPQWSVKSVTIGEEEYPASAGNGVEMVETVMPVERLLQETKLSRDGTEGTYWRCETNGVALWGGRRMAQYLVDHGIEHPWVVDEVVTAERVPDPDGPGTVPAGNDPPPDDGEHGLTH